MTQNATTLSYRYCGRHFTTEEIEWIRELIDSSAIEGPGEPD